MVDRFFRWPEAFALPDISADTNAKAFLDCWISRFGVSETLTTDRGGQFESFLWRGLMRKLGIRHICTTAYHPSANGMVERLHRALKAALLASTPETSWRQALPLVLLGIRTAIKRDLGKTVPELVNARNVATFWEFFQGMNA